MAAAPGCGASGLVVLKEDGAGQVGRAGSVGRAPGQVFQSRLHLPLRGVAAEVGHQAQAEGVRALPALYDGQVAGRLHQTLPEAQAAVILGQSVSLEVT